MELRMSPTDNTEERILRTTCDYLNRIDESRISSFLYEADLEFIPDGNWGRCGVKLLLPVEAQVMWERLPKESKESLEKCLREVCCGTIADQNGNKVDHQDIVIEYGIKLLEATDDWRNADRSNASKIFVREQKTINLLGASETH